MDLNFVFLIVVLSGAVSGDDPEVVRVKPGDDATLSCKAGDVSIRAVEWMRSDLKPEEYILTYSDGHPDTPYQPYAGRVQLVSGELKNGNVSLILKNVNNNDTGTYECRVLAGGSGRKKRAIIETEPIRRIQLEVTGSGSKNENTMNENTVDGNAHKHVGLAAGGLVCSAVVVVGLVILRKYKRHSDRNSEPAADEADVELV